MNGFNEKSGIEPETTAPVREPGLAENRDDRLEAAPTRPTILVVTRNGHMSEPVMDYALGVAERLGCRLTAAYVNTLPHYHDGGERNRRFAEAVVESAAAFKARAAEKRIGFEHVEESGKVGEAASRLCHAARRVEFVVIDQGIRLEEVASKSPAPVFGVGVAQAEGRAGRDGRNVNAQTRRKHAMSATTQKTHMTRTLVFGAMAAALYAAVFANASTFMTLCAKGGAYALLPVATVFAFSYVHGSFTSSFWSALGIESSKSVATRKTVETTATKRPTRDVRPRAQVNA